MAKCKIGLAPVDLVNITFISVDRGFFSSPSLKLTNNLTAYSTTKLFSEML